MAKKKKAAKAIKSKAKDLNFEQALGRLEQIIEKIDSGSISLEQGLEHYAQGMELIQQCRSVLNRAEQQIQRLSADQGGLKEAK
jgi:exodeoxyribonuclease VII small subunit